MRGWGRSGALFGVVHLGLQDLAVVLHALHIGGGGGGSLGVLKTGGSGVLRVDVLGCEGVG